MRGFVDVKRQFNNALASRPNSSVVNGIVPNQPISLPPSPDSVDKIEAAKSPDFIEAQQLSIGCAHLQ